MNIALIENGVQTQSEYCQQINNKHRGSTIYCFASLDTAAEGVSKVNFDLVLLGPSIPEEEKLDFISYVFEQNSNIKIEQCVQYFQK